MNPSPPAGARQAKSGPPSPKRILKERNSSGDDEPKETSGSSASNTKEHKSEGAVVLPALLTKEGASPTASGKKLSTSNSPTTGTTGAKQEVKQSDIKSETRQDALPKLDSASNSSRSAPAKASKPLSPSVKATSTEVAAGESSGGGETKDKETSEKKKRVSVPDAEPKESSVESSTKTEVKSGSKGEPSPTTPQKGVISSESKGKASSTLDQKKESEKRDQPSPGSGSELEDEARSVATAFVKGTLDKALVSVPVLSANSSVAPDSDQKNPGTEKTQIRQAKFYEGEAVLMKNSNMEWVPGKITRICGDGRYDVLLAVNGKKLTAASTHFFMLRHVEEKIKPRPVPLPGDRVYVLAEGIDPEVKQPELYDPKNWRKAIAIASVTPETVRVQYRAATKGKKEETEIVLSTRLRPRNFKISPGSMVLVRQRKVGTDGENGAEEVWVTAQCESLSSDGMAVVVLSSNPGVEIEIHARDVRPKQVPKNVKGTCVAMVKKHKQGDLVLVKVEAAPAGTGNEFEWKVAVIESRDNDTSTYSARFVDDTIIDGVHPRNIRTLNVSRKDPSFSDAYVLDAQEAAKEAISHGLDNDVDSNQGYEGDVFEAEPGEEESSTLLRFKIGSFVFAARREHGSDALEWYPGFISAVRSRNSYALTYIDGQMDPEVNGALIQQFRRNTVIPTERLSAPTSNANANVDAPTQELKLGDKVLARRGNKASWHVGVLGAGSRLVHGNYTVAFSDKVTKAYHWLDIHVLNPGRALEPLPERVVHEPWEISIGAAVLARKGETAALHLGQVSEAQGGGMYRVKFLESADEERVSFVHIHPLDLWEGTAGAQQMLGNSTFDPEETLNAHGISQEVAPRMYDVGTAVVSKIKRSSAWMRGWVSLINTDQTYDILTVNGDLSLAVPHVVVRKLLPDECICSHVCRPVTPQLTFSQALESVGNSFTAGGVGGRLQPNMIGEASFEVQTIVLAKEPERSVWRLATVVDRGTSDDYKINWLDENLPPISRPQSTLKPLNWGVAVVAWTPDNHSKFRSGDVIPRTVSKPEEFAVSQVVLARYPEHNRPEWHAACITRVCGHGFYDIQFSDGLELMSMSFVNMIVHIEEPTPVKEQSFANARAHQSFKEAKAIAVPTQRVSVSTAKKE